MGGTARFVTAMTLVASTALADEHKTHIEWRRDDKVVDDAMWAAIGTYVLSMWSSSIAQIACNGCTDHSYALLLVPLAGPAIAAAMPAVQQLSPAWSVILVADSALQIGAAAVALFAYLVPTRRVDVPNTVAWHLAPNGVALSF